MCITAAIRWQPDKDKAYISYILLDKDTYQVLLKPKKIELKKDDKKHIDKILKDFLDKISKQRSKQPIALEYKGVIRRSNPKPREDSRYFQDKIKKIEKDNIFKKVSRVRDNLKPKARRELKKTLSNLNIVNKNDTDEWIIHLWAVALHAIPSNLNEIDKKLKINYENKGS